MKKGTRHKDGNWRIEELTWETVSVAVLMDIRDELKQINQSLGCYRVPRALDDLNSLGKWACRRPKRRKKI